MSDKKVIYFLCTGNSCRSQMAEGFGKKYLGDRFDVYSKHLDDLDRRIQEMIWFRNELAKRYEKFNTLDSDTSPGTICGLIEQECRGAVDDTRTDER